MAEPLKVHITGVYGLIGNIVYQHLNQGPDSYEPYRAILEDRKDDIPADIPLVKHTDPVRPTEPYSMSKVWAEGACRTYNDAHDLSVICLRIGWVNKENTASGTFSNSIWCSHRDIARSFELALKKTAEPVYDICYALSDNKYRWVDLAHAEAVTGFVPQDRGED